MHDRRAILLAARSASSRFGLSLALPLGAAAWSSALAAQTDPSAVAAVDLDPVTVTATRVAEPAFDVPAAIDIVPGEAFNQDGLAVNLSEGLNTVPGLLARDRQNYAQDTQISIRGFGSRSTFGIRGVRLYLDGIPASQPDGQGQVAHYNLATLGSVEVLRGPFSALYGNSSGGVIEAFSADGSEPSGISFGAAAGSFDTYRASFTAQGLQGPVDYRLGYSWFETEGFRDHSRAERKSFNTKVNFQLNPEARLSLVLNTFSAPDADDPLGLTREQFDQDPSQATSVATEFNTRKSVDQTQVGAVFTQELGAANTVRVLGYWGTRQVEQYLSVPASAQASPTSQGGVVDLDNRYHGTDARFTRRTALAGRPLTLVAGLNYETLSQDRRGYENFIGESLGVRGSLRRDEVNEIDHFDQYAQASWAFADRWSALIGVRHSEVGFESDDNYIIDSTTESSGNPDDSGSADYSETTPVAGLMFRQNDRLHWYAAYGEGFETPTFVELAYRPDGGSGLNLALDSSTSRNAELGAKLKLTPRTRATVAVFQASTENELVVATNFGGRSTFQNAGETLRQGVEASLSFQPQNRLRADLAYTYLDAEFREDYLTCTGVPCFVPETVVAEGNRLPGIPESSLFAALRWGGESGLHVGADLRVLSQVPVNDLNAESAPSYEVVGLEAGYVFDAAKGPIRTFLRVDNLFDTDYVGSVIVNDGNGRFYEPAPGTSVLGGFSVDWNY